MIFRFYYQVLGGHTHVRVFAGTTEGALGKCGDLCFRNEEFVRFMQIAKRSDIQFIDEPLGYANIGVKGPS